MPIRREDIVGATRSGELRKLDQRMQDVGRRLGEREAEHVQAMEEARRAAEQLHERVERALERFHEAAAAAGAEHLRVELAPPRLDDKHLRSVEFELTRGQHRALVIVKSRGEVTFVGPFRTGKTEGPCRRFPVAATEEIVDGLGDFLERFLEQAATP